MTASLTVRRFGVVRSEQPESDVRLWFDEVDEHSGWRCEVGTAEELAAEFRVRLTALRDKVGRPTYQKLDAYAGRLGEELPKSTLSDLLNGRGRPLLSTVITFVRACEEHAKHMDLPAELFDETRWQVEYDRCWPRAGTSARTSDGVLVWAVKDFSPGAAGIHRAVRHTDSARQPELPSYVPREHDVELRERMAAAVADGGGVVLVTGRSCAGKTRSAWEAIRTDAFDGWQVVRPRSADQLRTLADSGALRGHTVVWLDELQRYLAERRHQELADEDLQALWSRHSPVVVIGTLWPDTYDEILNCDAGDVRDRGGAARSVLKLAGKPVRVPDRLGDAELDRAQQLAADDPYLAEALADKDHGMTQVLAGAPWLVQRWTQPRFAHTRCVLAAAAAAHRLGVHIPLSATLLREAARGYFPDRRPAPRDWFRQALAEAEQPIRHAVSALVPERGPDDDEQAVGYRLTDYLTQHVANGAGVEPIPADVWQALSTHITDPDELFGLARTASRRALYGFAERLYRQALAGGHEWARRELRDLLAHRLCFDEAIEEERCADNDSRHVMVSLLRQAGRLDDLRVLTESDSDAREQLDWALAEHGSAADLVDLARNLEKQDVHLTAVHRLAERREIASLRLLAAAGDSQALGHAAELLISDSRFIDAINLLREHDTARRHVRTLCRALLLDGRPVEAVNELRESHPFDLIDLLVHLRRFDELHALADSDTSTTDPMIANNARIALAQALRQENRTDEAIALLRRSTDVPDPYGHRAVTLAELLAHAGHVDEALTELRRIDDDRPTSSQYRNMALAARLLARAGRHDELRQLADEDWPVANHELGKLLRDVGRIDEAAERFARAADGLAYEALVDLALLVTDHDHLADYHSLLARYDQGRPWIGFDYRKRLAKLLAEQDRADDLRRASTAGNAHAEHFLAALLAFHHAPEKLARDAVSDDSPSLQALQLLAVSGFLAHPDELRRFGLTPNGDIALDADSARSVTPTLTRTPRREELILIAELAW
jgi:tetratricopeptide (TPR) repeat protein